MDPKILREAALAYQAVYDEDLRQEIEEQQDFENWVNSLVEEGYDLSEYTWKELYEDYGNIGGMLRGAGRAIQGALSGGYGGVKINKPTSPGQSGRYAAPSQQVRTPAAPTAPKQQAPAARPAATTPASRPSGGSSATAARPAAAAPTAKPASTASTPAKPAPGTKAAGPESIKPKTPNPLMQKTFGYQTGKAPDQVAKSPSPAPAATPTPAKRPMGSVKPGSLVSSFDMFDLVKGYLIGEGYADTEDAAISIMASMSEDWKTAIIAEARAEGVKAYRPNPTQAEVRADAAKAEKKRKDAGKDNLVMVQKISLRIGKTEQPQLQHSREKVEKLKPFRKE